MNMRPKYKVKNRSWYRVFITSLIVTIVLLVGYLPFTIRFTTTDTKIQPNETVQEKQFNKNFSEFSEKYQSVNKPLQPEKILKDLHQEISKNNSVENQTTVSEKIAVGNNNFNQWLIDLIYAISAFIGATATAIGACKGLMKSD